MTGELRLVSQKSSRIKLFREINSFTLFDLGFHADDNIRMSEPTMNEVGELQRKSRRKCTRIGVLGITLGLTASLVASPTVKREITATSDIHNVGPTVKRHWFQIGKASWYGGSFNGRKTANGERFDMYGLTCAHRTLPLGSWIRVTNLNNKKSAILRVNDRGPMATSLIVDLSYAAAQRLGVDGLAKVRIETVTTSDPKMAEMLVAQLHMADDPAVVATVEENFSTELMALDAR
jgi:rare lipoprotein A